MATNFEPRKFPPFLCFALARDERGRGLTIPEISQRSGIPQRTINRISKKLTWDNVKSKVIDDFLRGCNFQDARKQTDFMRKTARSGNAFSHLSKLRRKGFEDCIRKFREKNGDVK